MKNKKKKLLICSILFCIFSIGFITSYAFFYYNGETNVLKIKNGEINMYFSGEYSEITLSSAKPVKEREALENYYNKINFTIEYESTSDKDVYYEINLEYGDEIDGKTRIDDKYLRFDLFKFNSGSNTTGNFVFTNKSFDSIDHATIATDKLSPSSENYNVYKIKDDYDQDVCYTVFYEVYGYDENSDPIELQNIKDYCSNDGSYFSTNELTEWDLSHMGYLQALIDNGRTFSYVTVDDDGKILTDETSVSTCVAGFEDEYGTNTMWDSFCRGTSDAGIYSYFTITDYFNGIVPDLIASQDEIDYCLENGIISGTAGNYVYDVSKFDKYINYYNNNPNKLYMYCRLAGLELYNFSKNIKIGYFANWKYSFYYEMMYSYDYIGISQECLDEMYNLGGVFDFDYVGVDPNTESNSYRLIAWISDEVTVCDENCTYTQEEWNNLYATIKVSGYGDFEVKADVVYDETFYYTLADEAVYEDEASTYVTASSGIDLSSPASTTNGNGIYYISSDSSTTYDSFYGIFYARGVTKKVIFANYCWDVVGSTLEGGVKLLYSGVPTNGKCLVSSSIGTSKYNEKSNSVADVGFYYGERIEEVYLNKNDYSGDLAKNHYSEKIKYINGEYTLLSGSELSSTTDWSTSYSLPISSGARYTCLTTSDTCEEVYYIMDTNENGLYYLKLSGGETFEKAVENMTSYSSNENPSTIATYLNEWYENNLLSYADLLEDAPYCNYRTGNAIESTFKTSAKNTGVAGGFYYGVTAVDSSIQCPRNDAFTVNEIRKNNSNLVKYKYSNGILIYPIGLLTLQEATFMGIKSSTNTFWTMTPHNYSSDGKATVNVVSNTSTDFANSYSEVDEELDVRPVITLKFGTEIKKGTGTSKDPYVIK